MSENKVIEIDKKTYRFEEGSGLSTVYMYLLIGTKRALLIDTGYGEFPLKEQIAEITKLPLTVILTHAHFDHIGGSGAFSEVYLHPADMETYSEHGQMVVNAGKWVCNNIIPVKDNEVFDLGERTVRILHTPGHSPGCICILDETNRAVYTGDTCCMADVLLMFPTSLTLETYRRSINKLIAIEAEFDITWPSHHKAPVSSEILHDFQTACDYLIKGKKSGDDTSEFGMPAKRFRYKDIGIVYVNTVSEEK